MANWHHIISCGAKIEAMLLNRLSKNFKNYFMRRKTYHQFISKYKFFFKEITAKILKSCEK